MRRKNPQKAFDKNLEVLKSLGIDTSSVEDVKIDKTYKRQPEADSLDLISCIVYLDTGGAGFSKQVCAQCKQLYAVEYMYRTKGMLCSDECRAAHLEARGLYWDSTKPIHERWRKRIPLVVPSAALKVIEEINAERQQERQPIPPPDDDTTVRDSSSIVDRPKLEMPDLSEFGL